MKTLIKHRLSPPTLLGWVLVVFLVFWRINPIEAKPSNVGVSFQVFYDGLAPYGDWVSDPTYGYIWIPYVDAGFQPYRTNGYWVNSRFGNTWVSLYDWGWAPFHYGRWLYDDFYGWAWVPGYEWGPAWVEWRTGGGYYGWAPLMPRVGVHVSIGFPTNYWVFVPRRRLLARNIYNYYLPPRNVTVVYNKTTVINNTYVYNNNTYVSGPSRSELQQVTRRQVPVYEVSQGSRPGRATVERNTIQVYKPEISQASARGNSGVARPSRVYTAEEYSTRRNSRSDVGQGTSSRSNERNGTGAAAMPAQSSPRSSGTAAGSSSGDNNVTTVPRGSANRVQPAAREQASGARANPAVEQRSTRSGVASPAPNERAGTVRPSTPQSSVNGSPAVTGTSRSQPARQPSVQQRQATSPAQSQVRQATPAQRQVSPARQPARNTNASPSTQVRQNPPAQQRQVASPSRSNTQVNTNATQRSQTAPRVSNSQSRSSSARQPANSSNSSNRRGN